ncbi:MAG: hypothetical protein WA877_07940 [Legionella sp.]
MWRTLWHWACRRHPNKNLRWVKQRYYLAIENRRNMTFACKVKKTKMLTLSYVTDTKIIRHIKIVAAANPYYPKYDNYFKKRSGARNL